MLVGALLAVAAGVVAVVLAAGDGDEPTTAGREADAGPGTGDPARPGEGTKTSTTTTTTTVAQAPPKPDGSLSGAELNEQGFALIEQGRYDEAAAVLRHAVDSFPAGTSDLNYAYALYNLGHALRLAGRPEEAIPILEQRLEIPNQVETVERELAAARAAAGGGKEPKEPKQPKHEK